MEKTKKLAFAILVIFEIVLSQSVFSQSALDNYQLNVLQLLEVDSNLLTNRVKSILIEKQDSNGKKFPLEIRKYDRLGRLKEWIKFFNEKRNDSVVADYTWDAGLILVNFSVEYNTLLKLRSEWLLKKEFYPGNLKESKVGNVISVVKKYWKVSDSLAAVCDSNINCNNPLKFFYLIDKPANTYAYSFFNSSVIDLSDTIKEEKRIGTNQNYSIQNKMMIDGGSRKVKDEHLIFVADTLNYLEGQVVTLDSIGRIKMYNEYRGKNREATLSKRFIYDDSKKITRVERDIFPVTGVPDYVWIFNKDGDMIRSEAYSMGNKTNTSTDYHYIGKRLIQKEITRKDKSLISEITYHYHFY